MSKAMRNVMHSTQLGRFEDLLGISEVAGDVLRIAGHAAMSWLGFYVGVKEDGFISVVGWTLGTLAGAGTILDVVGLVKLLQGNSLGAPKVPLRYPAYPSYGHRA